jgi:Ser/Thr protein kinase RdoA (MazF antagonist)
VTAAAVAAAVRVARRHGVRVDDPVVLRARANLVVHLAPSPVVARIPWFIARMRARPEEWLEREVAVAAHAAARGGPVLAPTDLLPPGPHREGGHWMTFARLAPPPAPGTAPPAAAEALASLAALHGALADFPHELPLLVPVLTDVPAQVALFRGRGDHARADDWEARLTALEPALRALPAAAAVHGDAHAANLVRSGTDLVWLDFEDACRAPRAWDVASMTWPEPAGDAPGYPDPPPAAALDLMRTACDLQADAWRATAALVDERT